MPHRRRIRQGAPWTGIASVITAVITAATAVGALIFTAISLRESREQLALAAQGQFTDRYSRAIEQLGQQGADKLQIRLGGIYALERLARDSPRDQPTIIEVLTTFVRTNSFPKAMDTTCPDAPPTTDAQAALTVLGRRVAAHDNGSTIRLNNLCLTGANLEDANFNKAMLNETDLRKAHLGGANFEDASFYDADLSGAQLVDADLSGAHLERANLTEAELLDAKLVGANLSWTIITNSTNLIGADLSGAILEHASIPR